MYAAQSAIVLLSAISKGGGTRAGTTAALLKTKLPGSILGNVAFNAQGDVKGGPVAIYRIKGGKSTDYAVINPPESLVKAA